MCFQLFSLGIERQLFHDISWVPGGQICLPKDRLVDSGAVRKQDSFSY